MSLSETDITKQQFNWLENEKDRNNTPVPSSNLESDSCNALLGAQEVKRLDTRVSINIHSRRYRLTDPDGISAKAVLDGMVKTGILADDTAKQIKQITFSQEQISKSKEEETIVTISY